MIQLGMWQNRFYGSIMIQLIDKIEFMDYSVCDDFPGMIHHHDTHLNPAAVYVHGPRVFTQEQHPTRSLDGNVQVACLGKTKFRLSCANTFKHHDTHLNPAAVYVHGPRVFTQEQHPTRSLDGNVQVACLGKTKFRLSCANTFKHHDTHLNPAAVYVHGPRVFTQEQHPTRSLDGNVQVACLGKTKFRLSCANTFKHHDTHLNPAAVYVHGPRVFTQKQHPTRSLDGNVQVACLGKTKFRLSCANTFKHHDTHLNPAAVYVHGPRVFTQKQHPTRSLDGNVQVACLGKTKFRLSCANTFKHHDTHLNPAAVYVHGPRVFTQKQHPTRSLDGNVQVACLGKTKFRLSCANTFKHHDTHLNPAAVYVHGPQVFTQKQHPTRSLDGNVQVACLGKTKFRLSCANTFKQDKTRILLFGKY